MKTTRADEREYGNDGQEEEEEEERTRVLYAESVGLFT